MRTINSSERKNHVPYADHRPLRLILLSPITHNKGYRL
nr:MAG TPA: hypothetical protein [Caudoviricetes sp.]